MPADPIVSTGRGGAGNIGHDETPYTDASIVREGPVGESTDGATFSTGRGGAGNIGSPSLGPQRGRRGSQDVIPEQALREGQADFHTGRGGAGNEHREKYGGHSKSPSRERLGDKVKHLLHKDHKDHKQESPLQNAEAAE
ncbi:uncharacterized protein BDZ99DRAFT_214260 [Mytilinidion resinicola]|uniref:Uncharacterized protein n=1 Tax=Mytilinidion resinicola TaxID=574789 RepID=A0A6A6XZM2_9PEZI|nr:uncharacterized protein BDZ99DRAFT_214260 [Mytilinidion resinicola]KAF2801849.1 hypothetical protein BDZ99DRAFT_214260 [Mytilinidion resinicola]